MKVLHINSSPSGGAGIAAIRLHQALLNQRIGSKILFIENKKSNIPESYPFQPPSKTIFEKFFYKSRRKLGLAKNYWEKSNRLLQGRNEGFEMFTFPYSDYDITTQKIYKEADIINLHWTSGFLDFNFFKKNRKPVVWTLHDMNPFTGGCHYSNGCVKFTTGCANCPQLDGIKDPNLTKNNLSFKFKQLQRSNISVVTLNNWMLGNVRKSELLKNCRQVNIIKNSLDLSVFKPIDKHFARTIFNLPQNKTILLFVSEKITNKRKGFEILIECIEKINNTEIVFCAIGKNEENKINSKNVFFMDSVADERLMAVLYSSADALIIPSLEDNLPNVMLESLSCGIPVIAFPVGGITEIVNPEVNGVLADETNSNGLLKAIKKFLNNKTNFKQNTICKSAHELFDPSIQAEKYKELYQSILNAN